MHDRHVVQAKRLVHGGQLCTFSELLVVYICRLDLLMTSNQYEFIGVA